MNLAMRREIGFAASQMEAIDLQNFVRKREAERFNALHAHMRNFSAERLHLGDGLQIAWCAQGSADVQRALKRRLSRDLSLQVNTQQRVDVETVKRETQVGRKVVLQHHVARNRQVRFLEVRMSFEIELAPMRDGVEIEIAFSFSVVGKVLDTDVRLQRRLVDCPGEPHRKTGDAIRRETGGVEIRKAAEIEVACGEIDANLTVGKIALGEIALGKIAFRQAGVRR